MGDIAVSHRHVEKRSVSRQTNSPRSISYCCSILFSENKITMRLIFSSEVTYFFIRQLFTSNKLRNMFYCSSSHSLTFLLFFLSMLTTISLVIYLFYIGVLSWWPTCQNESFMFYLIITFNLNKPFVTYLFASNNCILLQKCGENGTYKCVFIVNIY